LENNNIAQQELETYIETISKKTKELRISIPLNGHVNLAILSQKGFTNIQHILFQEQGQITSIINIPQKVKTLACQHNLLEELRDLPESLEELRISHNLLSTIDLSTCKKLKQLYISYNRLSTLSGLAESLTLLHCDHNNLVHLNLDTTVKLVSLHCDNNQGLVLENLPDTLVDAQYPSTIIQNNRTIEEAISNDYVKSLNEYFRIKSNYEKTEATYRRSKNKNKPTCKGCDKAVGMVFSNADGKYQARCGGNPPCEWKMVLHRGNFASREDVLYTYLDDVNKMKEGIIQQKMATLFHHMGEKKAKELFDEQMKGYTSANEFLEQLQNKQNELYFNEEKLDQMNKIQKRMNELLETVRNDLRDHRIEDAVRTQYKDIFPLSQSIQKMQYEVMEMYETFRMVKESEDDSAKKDLKYHLVQEPLHFTKLEINLGEAPSVGGT
jgi:hypothetical protein